MSRKAHNIGKKKDLVRSVPAGFLHVDCPVAHRLMAQRVPLIAWMSDLAALLFRPNPLVKTTPGTQARAEDLAKGSPWFSGYAQALAGTVATRIDAVEKRLRRRLAHGLRTCDEVPKRARKRATLRPKPADGPPRRFVHVPIALQDHVCPADFKVLKDLAEQDAGCWRLFGELRDLQLAQADGADGADTGHRQIYERYRLSAVQGAMVREIATSAFSRYTCPVFNRLGPRATDRFTLRLELDARSYADRAFRNKPNAFRADLNQAMEAAWAGGEKRFATAITALDLLHRQRAKLPHLTIPVTISRAVWQTATKLDTLKGRQPSLANVCLEIGPERVAVKVGIRLERTTPDIALTGKIKRHKAPDDHFAALEEEVNRRRVVLGRDVGMINTVALGAVLRSRAVTADQLRSATFLTKEAAREYLTGHAHPAEPADLAALFAEPGIAARLALLDEKSRNQLRGANPRRFCGRDFLDCIARHGAAIDTYREEIDENYKTLGKLKTVLLKPLELASAETRIPDRYRSLAGNPAEARHPDPFVQSLIDKFFRILDLTLQLKDLRRDRYRKIDAVKAHWFGWVSTREALLAWVLDAVVVREDASYKPIELDDPKYMGRAFNRMMANAARGLYEAVASAKLAWLGIPELRAPSFHTSTWDMRFAVVDAAMRRGEVFVGVDGQHWHADEHAALGVAVWYLLNPIAAELRNDMPALEETLVPA